jgi:folate-dependent tRNA-U54 methylase TrmFO/GidA
MKLHDFKDSNREHSLNAKKLLSGLKLSNRNHELKATRKRVKMKIAEHITSTKSNKKQPMNGAEFELLIQELTNRLAQTKERLQKAKEERDKLNNRK